MNRTEGFDGVAATAPFVAMLFAVAQVASAAGVTTPHEAIARAIAQRLGSAFTVSVTSLDTTVVPQPGLAALPEPGGRSGQPMRFVMTTGTVRRGVAVATFTVSGTYARAARAIARDEVITNDAIEVVQGELPSMGLKRMPAGADAVGLTARRNIAAGEALTEAVLELPPLVRTGDALAVSVSVGAVEITTNGTASGSGFEGDIIRVMPRSGGRPVKARITGPGAVEILQ